MSEESSSTGDEPGLTPAELQTLRERLEAYREQLATRLGREQAVAQQAEPTPEPLEAAEQTREQDDAITFSRHDRTLLAEVHHALAKMDAGTYGLSEVSGLPIGYRRLLAVPWARLRADEAEAGA